MKVAAVVGPGRSATSAVAKGLHLAGFPMGGRLLPASPSNPHGHYEDMALIGVNDSILADLDGSWCSPPPTLAVEQRAGEFVARAADYIDSRGPAQWGMKDPRLTLVWPVWRAAFAARPDIDLIVVRVSRDAARSGLSLARRDGMSAERATALTLEYQRRLDLWAGMGGNDARSST